MASVATPITMPKAAAPLPAPNVDFYELVETLPAEEQAVGTRGGDHLRPPLHHPGRYPTVRHVMIFPPDPRVVDPC